MFQIDKNSNKHIFFWFLPLIKILLLKTLQEERIMTNLCKAYLCQSLTSLLKSSGVIRWRRRHEVSEDGPDVCLIRPSHPQTKYWLRSTQSIWQLCVSGPLDVSSHQVNLSLLNLNITLDYRDYLGQLYVGDLLNVTSYSTHPEGTNPLTCQYFCIFSIIPVKKYFDIFGNSLICFLTER